MTMPTASSAIAPQTADSHDAEKNIFPDELRGDDKGRAGNEAGERRSNNDPRHTKQPRQNN